MSTFHTSLILNVSEAVFWCPVATGKTKKKKHILFVVLFNILTSHDSEQATMCYFCLLFCFVLKFIPYLLEFVISDLTSSIQKRCSAFTQIIESNDKYKNDQLKDGLFGIILGKHETIKNKLCVNLFHQCVQYFILFGRVFSPPPTMLQILSLCFSI